MSKHLFERKDLFRLKSEVCSAIREMKKAGARQDELMCMYNLRKLVIRVWFRNSFRVPLKADSKKIVACLERKDLRNSMNECLEQFCLKRISSGDREYKWFLRKVLGLDKKTRRAGGTIRLVPLRHKQVIRNIAQRILDTL